MGQIRLPGVVDITAGALAPLLVVAAREGDLDVDASAVTRIDASGLQVLVAAAIAVRARQARIHWHSPTSTLVAAARTLGVCAELGLPVAES